MAEIFDGAAIAQKPVKPKTIDSFIVQLKLVFVHIVNLVSNILGNDFFSCYLRRILLRLLGIQLGAGTIIRGGGYLYGGGLVSGARCQVNRGCYFDFTSSIILGDDVVVGHGVTFITAEHEIADPTCRAGSVFGRPIVVGNGVWIGAKATILPNIVIGSGAIVAAGAVVTKDVLPNVIVAGIPAKVIRELK